jgi:hypothetical protein
MEGCKYCTANEPETSLGEWLFDEKIIEKGKLHQCRVGIVIIPEKAMIEYSIVDPSEVGDTTGSFPINYCPMCGRKMRD